MLAYLFWHTRRGGDAARYHAGLAAFHDALAADPPLGFVRSWTLGVLAAAWLPPAPAYYLDWYVVESFTALGALNDAAVSGTRQGPHDAVAALAGTGVAGVTRLLTGDAVVPAAPVLGFLDKPAGTSYAGFGPALDDAAAGASCWMRQMTLGPGPEFIVLADGRAPALPWPVTVMEATVVVG